MGFRAEEYFEKVFETNRKAYEKEERLAMSIADRIPKEKAAQDQRSKNRFREHSGEGCILVDAGRESHHQPNHTFHTCACGWMGWLIPKEDVA